MHNARESSTTNSRGEGEGFACSRRQKRPSVETGDKSQLMDDMSLQRILVQQSRDAAAEVAAQDGMRRMDISGASSAACKSDLPDESSLPYTKNGCVPTRRTIGGGIGATTTALAFPRVPIAPRSAYESSRRTPDRDLEVGEEDAELMKIVAMRSHDEPAAIAPARRSQSAPVKAITPIPAGLGHGVAVGIIAGPPTFRPSTTISYDNQGRPTKSGVTDPDSCAPGAYACAPNDDAGPDEPSRRRASIDLGSYTPNTSRSSISVSEDTRETAGVSESPSSGPVGAEEAEAAEDDKTEPTSRCNTAIILASVVLLIVVALVVVIPVVVLLGGSEDSFQDSIIVEQEPSRKDGIDFENFTTVVPNLTLATLEALKDSQSPQYKAFMWMKDEIDLDTQEVWKRQQRFAVVTFYFALNELVLSGKKGALLNHHLDECVWLRNEGNDGCHDNGRIRRLSLSNEDRRSRGSIPAEVAFLTQLEGIDIDHTVFHADLATVLPADTSTTLASLKWLRVSNAGLTGSIPSSLGLLTGLTNLDLSRNNLEATIPTELGLLAELESLNLSRNILSGSLPESLGDLPSLISFSIQENPQIDESLPPDFCRNDRPSMNVLQTDWCQSSQQCCT